MTTTPRMIEKIESMSTRNILAAAAIVAAVLFVSAPASGQTKRPPAAAEENQKALLEEIKALRAQVERLQKTVYAQQERTGGMPGGPMKPEHPMGAMGGGDSPTAMPDSSIPGMKGHMDEMKQHMDEMHGGGMGSSPAQSAPTAPPSNPSGGMGHM